MGRQHNKIEGVNRKSFFPFFKTSSLRISNNRICCINYSLQRLIGIIYNWYIDTKEGIQVIQVALFLWLTGLRIALCLTTRAFEPPWLATSLEIFRQMGVCAVKGLGERAEWGGLQLPPNFTLIVLYRWVQLNSIKTNPKKTFYSHFIFQAEF